MQSARRAHDVSPGRTVEQEHCIVILVQSLSGRLKAMITQF